MVKQKNERRQKIIATIKKICDLIDKKNKKKSVELYYKLVDDDENSLIEVLDFIDIKETRVFKGVSLLKMTDSKFNVIKDSKLVFEGKRIVVDNPSSDYKINQYLERGYIELSEKDKVEFSGLYSDSGLTFASEVPFTDYLILNGTGIFSGYNTLRIKFDNEGKIFSNKKKTRKITLFNV